MTMDPMDAFAQRYNELNKSSATKKTGFKNWRENTGWARMNAIQKTGAICFFVFFTLSLLVPHTLRIYFDISSQTCLFLGWVAGSLWRVRHALHFWWSLVIAVLGHIGLLSIYVRVNRYFDASYHPGREIATVIVGMIALETLVFLFILKRIALWLHRRVHTPPQMEAR